MDNLTPSQARRKAAAEAGAAIRAANAAATGDEAGTRTKIDTLYGEGRISTSQPGATQYQGSNGRYSVQIWDES